VNRVVVIGATGSGKSTFASALAAKVGAPHVEVDDLFWNPGWVETDLETFRARIDEVTAADRWVLAGNYFSRIVDITWPRADTVVWLDLSLPLVLYRSVVRTIRRGTTKELVCTGNTEKVRFILPERFTGETPLWLFAWRFKKNQHPRIEAFIAANPHLTVHRLCSRAEVARFLGSLRPPEGV
jgi:adenylate kinase family enzyme